MTNAATQSFSSPGSHAMLYALFITLQTPAAPGMAGVVD